MAAAESVWDVYKSPLQAQAVTGTGKPPAFFCQQTWKNGHVHQYVVKGPVTLEYGLRCEVTDKVKHLLRLAWTDTVAKTYRDGTFVVAYAVVPYDPTKHRDYSTPSQPNLRLVHVPPTHWDHPMLQSDALALEVFVVLAFRWCIGTNDTVPRNILVVRNSKGRDVLYSIDDPALWTAPKNGLMWNKQMKSDEYNAALRRVFEPHVKQALTQWKLVLEQYPGGGINVMTKANHRFFYQRLLVLLKGPDNWQF